MKKQRSSALPPSTTGGAARIAVMTAMALIWLISGCAAQKPKTTQTDTVTGSGRAPIALISESTPVNQDATPEDLLQDDWLEDDLELDEDYALVSDPIEGFNRAIFTFNDRLYFWALKPAARGYRVVFPETVRTGVSNFFHNLGTPVRLVNAVLQGKIKAAEAELTAFLYNSTVGVLGFGNPAKNHPALNPDPEDLGQTFGHYGIGNGFYIVWPVLGPSTLRDSIGSFGDRYAYPITYVDPTEASLALNAYDSFNQLSFRIGDYESLKQAALDPYEAMRNAYIQLRQAKIRK